MNIPGITTVDPSALLDTPEAAVRMYLRGWQAGDFGAAYAACTKTWKQTNRPKQGAETIRALHAARTLEQFGDPERTDALGGAELRPAVAGDYAVPVVWYDLAISRRVRTRIVVRVIREAAAYKPGEGPGSAWGVNPLSALRELPGATVDPPAPEVSPNVRK